MRRSGMPRRVTCSVGRLWAAAYSRQAEPCSSIRASPGDAALLVRVLGSRDGGLNVGGEGPDVDGVAGADLFAVEVRLERGEVVEGEVCGGSAAVIVPVLDGDGADLVQ